MSDGELMKEKPPKKIFVKVDATTDPAAIAELLTEVLGLTPPVPPSPP